MNGIKNIEDFRGCNEVFVPKRPNSRVVHSGYARVLRVETNMNIPPVTVLLGGIKMD